MNERLIARGRALKYQAAGAVDPGERSRLFAEASSAYAHGGAASTYALVNAATLARLAGQKDLARTHAGAVRDLLASGRHDPDTPYWLAATRAEALLVLDDPAAAESALAEAVGLAPRAWEEHAITLRQFGLLLRETGQDASWIERFRPPPVVAFGGLMGLSPEDAAAREAVAEAVRAIGPCEAYGALAAGADLLVAEAALAGEAELHVVLPDSPDGFRISSVEAVDPAWGDRFDACLEWASVVQTVAGEAADAGANAAFAAEIAMGRAIARAQTLETAVVGVLVTADEGRDRAVAALWRQWEARGLPLRRVEVERSATGPGISGESAAALAIVACDGDTPSVREFASLAEALAYAGTRPPSRIGLDYRLADRERTRPHALALALLGATSENGVRASANAADAARLVDPRITGEIAGAVNYEGGMADFHRLALPGKG